MNNLEPITSDQEFEGIAESKLVRLHLLQLCSICDFSIFFLLYSQLKFTTSVIFNIKFGQIGSEKHNSKAMDFK